MSPEVKTMTDHLDALSAFIGNPIHKMWVDARKVEVDEIKGKILITPPVNQDAVSSLLLWHGELECLEAMITTFEDGVRLLKDRIDKKVEEDNETSTTKV